jgi:UDP-N-acetylglucosamine 2-epimerase (non-hydrolysing)
MIDTLEANRAKAEQLIIKNIIKENMIEGQPFDPLESSNTHNSLLTTQNSSLTNYALMTLHRPSNVDDKEILSALVGFLEEEVTKQMPIIWPIHPRTQKQMKDFGLWNKALRTNGLILLHPLGYLEMVRLNMDAHMMFTDSGGLQEECCVLGTPCLTLRWNTERPITLRENGGVTLLVGNSLEKIRKGFKEILHASRKPSIPEKWDGKTAQRCLQAILNYDKA